MHVYDPVQQGICLAMDENTPHTQKLGIHDEDRCHPLAHECRFNILFDAGAKQDSVESREALEKVHEMMSDLGVAPDRVTINAKINHAILQGKFDEAKGIFEKTLDGVSAVIRGRCLHDAMESFRFQTHRGRSRLRAAFKRHSTTHAVEGLNLNKSSEDKLLGSPSASSSH